jgi:glutathione synthase/RimK-type ligase-like ATP-grasp enzyme
MHEFDLEAESIYLKDVLNKRGINASIQNWDVPSVDWSKADLVISRHTSAYMWDPEAFMTWAKQVEETTTLWNTSPAMEWSHHKRYLIELQQNGIPMPETLLIPKNSKKPMSEVLDEIPWDDFVLKPTIGAGSCGLKRFTKESSDFEEHLRNLNKHGFKQEFPFGEYEFLPCDTLIQQYVPEISKNGEISLIFFSGEYSHCVSKMVKTGDYRAHPIWGAEVQLYDPSEREIEVASDSLKVMGHPTEFARIDIIPAEPDPLLIEVELIDPFLFFDHVPETAEVFTDHIQKFLNNR